MTTFTTEDRKQAQERETVGNADTLWKRGAMEVGTA